MPNPIMGPPSWLAELLRDINRRIDRIATQPVLAMASSDGANGYMKISANAVSGQPAIEFHYTGGGGDLLGQVYQTTGGAIQITGGLQVSGTKNFVMNHPAKPGWTLRHAATESPVNGVEYWGTGTLGTTGQAVVTLPSYFASLAKSRNLAVLLTPQYVAPPSGSTYAPPALAASAVANGAFTAYGPAGTPFSWLVKAERQGTALDWDIEFDVEEYGTVDGPPAPAASTVDQTIPRMTS